MQTNPRWNIFIPLFFASVIFMPWNVMNLSDTPYPQAHSIFTAYSFLIFPPDGGFPAVLSLMLEWVLFAGLIYWVSLLEAMNSRAFRVLVIGAAIFLVGLTTIFVPWAHPHAVTSETIFDQYDLIWQPNSGSVLLDLVLAEILAVIGLAILATKLLLKKAGASEEVVSYDSLSLN
jgi:hypothetical protein